MDGQYHSISKGTVSNSARVTKQLEVKPSKISEMLFLNEEHSILLLTESEEVKINKVAQYLNGALEKLRQVQEECAQKLASKVSNTKKDIERARQKVIDAKLELQNKIKTIRNQFDFIPQQATGSYQSGELDNRETVAGVKFSSIYRFREQSVTLIPSELLDAFKKTPKGHKKLFPLKKVEHRSIDKGRYYIRDPKTGEWNKERVKEVWGDVKASVKAEWKLMDPKDPNHNGRVPVSALFNPVIGQLFEDELDLLDKWIDELNKKFKWQYKQFESEKQEILTLLDKPFDEFTSDDLGKVREKMRYIWKDNNKEIASWLERFNSRYQYPITKEQKKAIKEKVNNLPVPPATYSWESGVDFMRYSYGATLGGAFDLKAGKIAFDAKAEAKLSLVDAKGKISGYLPNEKGHKLSFSLARAAQEHYWAPEYNHGLPALHFDFDKSFIKPEGLQQLNELLEKHHFEGMVVYIEGHTDKVGGERYNQLLSEERALATKAYLTNEPALWFRFFLYRAERWGKSEVKAMLEALGSRLPSPVYSQEESHTMGSTPLMLLTRQDFRDNCIVQDSPWFIQTGGQRLQPYISPDFNLNFINDRLGLLWLIQRYFHEFRNANNLKAAQAMYTTAAPSKMVKGYAGKGESAPLEATEQRSPLNRRVEFIPFTLKTRKVDKPTTTLNFGNARLVVEGYASGWSGAALSVAAQIDIDVNQGILHLKEGVPATPQPNKAESSPYNKTKKLYNKGSGEPEGPATAGVQGDVFIGAKAEAGVKAAMEWQNPNPRVDSSGKPQAARWCELGSVGYTVTGSAGVGLSGDFKVGWDDHANKFVIKAKAQACLGLGFGGGLAFTVDARHVWNFMVLVHDKLCEADFTHIDVFETANDVFDRISAFGYELIKHDDWTKGVLILGVGSVGKLGTQVMQKLDWLLDKWQSEEQKVDDLHTLIRNIITQKALLMHLTPETKGRLLHDLLYTPSDIIDFRLPTWTGGIIKLGQDIHFGGKLLGQRLWGVNEAREEAVLTLLEYGIQSRNDFDETLEHMTPRSCKTGVDKNTLSCDVAARQKIKSMSMRDKNFEQLKDFLDDWGDSYRLETWYDKKILKTAKIVAGKTKKPIARP